MKNKNKTFLIKICVHRQISIFMLLFAVSFIVNIQTGHAKSCAEQFGSTYTCANTNNVTIGADCKTGDECPNSATGDNFKCCLTSHVTFIGGDSSQQCAAGLTCIDPQFTDNIGMCTNSCVSQTTANGRCCPLAAPSTTPPGQTTRFDYPLLETFPGFFQAKTTMTDLPTMILSIYKFGIWTVGIAGLFMLVVGGFIYMTSAGNTSTAGNARGIIWDALLGIVAALGAYLILYVINPDLTKINLNFTTVDLNVTEGTPMGAKGVCAALASGDCSVSNLTSVFGEKATEASSICNGESEGKAIPSGSDICADGAPASWGLFQINITVHSIGGYPCPDAFSGGGYTSKNHNCRVKLDSYSQSLYQNCITAAKIASNNIAAAKSIYGRAGNSWKQWGANVHSNCNFH